MKNKIFTVTYEVLGGKRTDWVDVEAKNIKEAIDVFEAIEWDVQGIKYHLTQYSIITIKA